MLTDENRQHILNGILDIVSTISDKEYQEKAWIMGVELEGGYSYDEAVCQFFDETESILNEYKDYRITKDQYYILRNFLDKFAGFSSKNHWPPEFIDTPKWDEITKMAKDVLKAFNYKKK